MFFRNITHIYALCKSETLGALLDQSKKASNVEQANQYANQAGWHGRHLVRKARCQGDILSRFRLGILLLQDRNNLRHACVLNMYTLN